MQEYKQKINKTIILKKDLFCLNCGYEGHSMKNCDVAVTSLGIILLMLDINEDFKTKFLDILSKGERQDIFKLNNNKDGIIIDDVSDIELFCALKNSIKYLLIRRKHTLGFLEFIRGRYNIENVDGIIFLFKQMTPYEIGLVKILSFDELWDYVWGDNKNKPSYQSEYIQSKEKFKRLKSEENGYLNLNFYIENVLPNFDVPEWGFPKGRRNFKESDQECATREFLEETGYNENEFIILDNIEPIEELFIGTNGVSYKHIYYVAVSLTDKKPKIDFSNVNQKNEIGDIGFSNYEEAMKIIRPYHTERQRIITQLYIFVINNLIQSLKNEEKNTT